MMDTDPIVGDRLDAKAAILLTVLCLIWGFNAVAIKFSNEGIAPLFGAGLRSVIASVSFFRKRRSLMLIG